MLQVKACKGHADSIYNGINSTILGANSGIGLETAVDLAKRGARVILACRSVERGERAAVEVRRRSGNQNVVFVQLDLASLTSIRAFAEKICQEEPQINILVNNAGVFAPSLKTTEDGFDYTFGVNHLGPFLLTNLLLEKVKASQSPRIVNVSSLGSLFGKMDIHNLSSPARTLSDLTLNDSTVKYNQSKLANNLFTRSLAKKFPEILATTVHPGVVSTEIAKDINSLLVHIK